MDIIQFANILFGFCVGVVISSWFGAILPALRRYLWNKADKKRRGGVEREITREQEIYDLKHEILTLKNQIKT